jgi:hypothetical protein
MRRLLIFLMISVLMALMVGMVFTSYLKGIAMETRSIPAAGTLVLDIRSEGADHTRITVGNGSPGQDSLVVFRLDNVESLQGHIDLEDLLLAGSQSACIEPVPGVGELCGSPGWELDELQRVVDLTLFTDRGCDGRFDREDTLLYSGLVRDLPPLHVLDGWPVLSTGSCTVALFDLWLRPVGNHSTQTTGTDLDTTFTLAVIMGRSEE